MANATRSPLFLEATFGALSIRALVVRFTDGGEQIRQTLLITLTNRFERDRGGYEGRIRWYGGTAMSTDELIVQGFEWLVDYSQNYAENCRDGRCSSAKGTPKSLEQSFGDRGSPTSVDWTTSPGRFQERVRLNLALNDGGFSDRR